MNFHDDNYPEVEWRYTPEQALLIKGALFDLMKEAEHSNCVGCGKHIDLNFVHMYDHDGGWNVIDSIPKQWISVECEHCGYHTSINKLGVSR